MRTFSGWSISVALSASMSYIALAATEQPKQQKAQTFSWMYVREKNRCIISNLSPTHAFALQEGVSGEFLWYQEEGRAFLIKSPSALTEVRRYFESEDPKKKTPSAEGRTIQKLSRVAIKNGLVTPMPYPPAPPN